MRLIDADELKERAGKSRGKLYSPNAFIGAIETAPTIEAEPVRHGRWIDGYPEDYARGISAHFKCYECGRRTGIRQTRTYKYCPNCGAKMDGETP